jgi:hypothetical protein
VKAPTSLAGRSKGKGAAVMVLDAILLALVVIEWDYGSQEPTVAQSKPKVAIVANIWLRWCRIIIPRTSSRGHMLYQSDSRSAVQSEPKHSHLTFMWSEVL